MIKIENLLEGLWKLNDAAEYIDISPSLLRSLCIGKDKFNRLPPKFYKIYRQYFFTRYDLDKWLKKNLEKPVIMRIVKKPIKNKKKKALNNQKKIEIINNPLEDKITSAGIFIFNFPKRG